MMVVAGVVVAGIASWVAAPFLGMARHGTLDQRTVASWRTVTPATSAVAIPAPRVPADTARTSRVSA